MLHNIVQRVSIILHDSKLNQLRWFDPCTLRIRLNFKHVENNNPYYANLVNSYVFTLRIYSFTFSVGYVLHYSDLIQTICLVLLSYSARIFDESRAKCKYVEQTKGFGYIYFMSHLFDKQHYVSILSDFSQIF